jgi:hypothetical protein
VVAVNGKDWYGYIDVGILVVDMVECSAECEQLSLCVLIVKCNLPVESLARIAKHLQFARLLAIAVHAKTPHNLIHRLPARLIVVEEITSKKHHVDIASLGQTHDLVEGFPAIIASYRVAFVVTDMVICGDQYADCIRIGEVGHLEGSVCYNEFLRAVISSARRRTYLGEKLYGEG